MRIPVGIEEACSGSDQSSGAIKFDRTTFHHDSGIKNRQFEFFPDQGWNYIVELERRIFPSPGIITPVNNGFRLRKLRVYEESWSVVPAPRIIGWMKIE